MTFYFLHGFLYLPGLGFGFGNFNDLFETLSIANEGEEGGASCIFSHIFLLHDLSRTKCKCFADR